MATVGDMACMLCLLCLYEGCFVVVFDCQICFLNVEMVVEGLDLGKHRTDLRPSEDLLAFLSSPSATSHL